MSSMAKAISIDRTSLAELCRRHHIRRLSLFGSVLRPDFRPDSDVDVLVEFEPGQVPGFLALHDLEAELSKLLGSRKVDLVTQRSLNHRLRDRVLSSAEVEYAAG
jgi:predicted nucleotidyltransferase